MSSPLNPEHFPGVVEYFPEHQLLFCHVHKQPLPLRQLEYHLTRSHAWPVKVRRPVIEHCRTLAGLENLEDLRLRPDYSLPLDFLPLYESAFSCCYCRYLTINLDCINKHLNKVHGQARVTYRNGYTRVSIQSWYQVVRSQYWIVQSAETGLSDHHPQAHVSIDTIIKEEATLLERLEQQEINRLISQEEDDISWDTEIENSDTTPWLQYTKWPKQFNHRPLEIIAATARQPEPYICEDYILGFWNGEMLASPVESEVRLQTLLILLDLMFERCEETLETSSHQVQCWVKSIKPGTLYPYPLKQLERKSSRKRYLNLWRRFLCYVFRVAAFSEEIQSTIYGLVLTEQQQVTIAHIWGALKDQSLLGSISNTACPNPRSNDQSEDEQLQRDTSTLSTGSTASNSEREISLSLSSSSGDDECDPSSFMKLSRPEITEWLFALSCQFVA